MNALAELKSAKAFFMHCCHCERSAAIAYFTEITYWSAIASSYLLAMTRK
jgi:hypothetical protein